MNAPRIRWSLRMGLVVILLALSGAILPAQRIQYQAVGTRAMVASAHSLATQAGLDILKKGGNAFDAAVAVAATLNVVEPSRSGMGGVGFMTLYVAKTGEVVSLQMTGAAPYAATPDRFKNKRDQEAGYLAGVVPGNFGGWVTLLDTYGTMTLADVFATAVQYADQGFPVDSYLRETLDDSRSALEIFPTTAAVFVPNGALPTEGERLVQKDLANTFRRILAVEAGARKAGGTRTQALTAAYDFFYKGALAQEFVAFYKVNDGLFTLKDFADYQPVWAKPIHTTYKEYEVYSNGPTSRGGIQTLMNLNLLESYDLKAVGLNSAEYIHLLAESIKLVNADVYRYVADPKVATIPLDGLLSKAYAAERQRLIRLDQASPYAPAGNPSAGPKPGSTTASTARASRTGLAAPDTSIASYDDDPNTTHFDIVDAAGNAVACTPTIGTFGTKVVVGRTGIIFHNATRYGSFSPYKDDVNFIGGGKTPLINNSPLIALKNGRLFMVWGTPGGESIGQTQMQVFLNVVEFGMGIQDAIEATRIELRAKPDFYRPGAEVSVGFESRLPEAVRKALQAKGNQIRVEDQPFAQVFGGMQGILVNQALRTLTGGADPRRGGCALGY
ncbi:MAG TPA: gamma-glutamyltransferase [Vicinamibacterales bacterium]